MFLRLYDSVAKYTSWTPLTCGPLTGAIWNDSLFLRLYESVDECTSPPFKHLPHVADPCMQSRTTPCFKGSSESVDRTLPSSMCGQSMYAILNNSLFWGLFRDGQRDSGTTPCPLPLSLVVKEDWPLRGLKLIMWSEGQWEALKKLIWKGDIYIQIYIYMDIATTRPNRPSGPIRWKLMLVILL